MKKVQGIYLPDTDTHFEAHLRKGEIFKGKGTYQYKKLAKSVNSMNRDRFGVALDIGAHCGLWARVLSHVFEKVIAFEPIESNFECLVKNTEENGNVTPYLCGLSNGDDALTFNSIPDNTGNSCVSESGKTVACSRLDNFKYTGIDFIKIDVEGWELPVLQGAKETIKRSKPYVLIEQKPGNAEKYGFGQYDALDYLKSLGMVEQWCKAGDHFLSWKD